MNAQELTAKYVAAMEKTLEKLQRVEGEVVVSQKCVDEIFGYVKSYLKDAKYYQYQKMFETSLTSIAYCEGLLDALKMIGAVNIS